MERVAALPEQAVWWTVKQDGKPDKAAAGSLVGDVREPHGDALGAHRRRRSFPNGRGMAASMPALPAWQAHHVRANALALVHRQKKPISMPCRSRPLASTMNPTDGDSGVQDQTLAGGGKLFAVAAPLRVELRSQHLVAQGRFPAIEVQLAGAHGAKKRQEHRLVGGGDRPRGEPCRRDVRRLLGAHATRRSRAASAGPRGDAGRRATRRRGCCTSPMSRTVPSRRARVVAEHAVLLRAQRLDGALRAKVEVVGAQADDLAAERLERVRRAGAACTSC